MTKPKDMTEPNQLDICENPPSQRFSYLQPCCRESGHKDKCAFWQKEVGPEGDHNIHVYEIVGGRESETKAETIWILDMEGNDTPYEEVAALIQYLEWMKD